MYTDMRSVANQTTVYCNYLIETQVGGAKGLAFAISINKEVYDFPSLARTKYNQY